jgi:glycosyltransferase involved in cell wall biosynthesis
MTSPNVDVVIPVYNAASTLEGAVGSIQKQSYSAIRIILVDDGSTDETPNLLAKIAAADSRIIVLRQENSGIVDALNRGWKACDAPLIARHDADDIAAPDRLAKQVAFLENNPDVIAVSGAFRHINAAGETTGKTVRLPPLSDANPQWVPAREPYLLHPFLMLRRAALEAVGGYRYVFHAEDADLYWRLQERGKLVNLDDVLGDYRLSSDSISSRSIVNGRIQALSSQLAALSAVRRRSNRGDITFTRGAIEDYRAATTLSEMVRIAGAQLAADERAHLAIATCEKLRQLSTYRPYELELSDCQFVSASYKAGSRDLSPENRHDIAVRLSGAAARLIVQGRFRSGLALCPLALYPFMALRVLAQLVLPAGTREGLRARLHGQDLQAS